MMNINANAFCNHKVDEAFLNAVSELNQTIMGISFDSHASFLKARDMIQDNIFRGVYPSAEDVAALEKKLDNHHDNPAVVVDRRVALSV